MTSYVTFLVSSRRRDPRNRIKLRLGRVVAIPGSPAGELEGSGEVTPRAGSAAADGSVLCGLLGESECEDQEAGRSEPGVDSHADPGAAPPLDDVGQDQRDRHKGYQDLPREGGVEQ